MLKDIKEKRSHLAQLLWNCLAIHVHILQPSDSIPSHVPWRNACTCKPGDTTKNVYCIFITATKQTNPKPWKLLSGSCPSTGKWLHSGIEYFTAVKITELQLHVISRINLRNKTFREQIKQQKAACRMMLFLQSSKTKLKIIQRDTWQKIKFLFKSRGMINIKLSIQSLGEPEDGVKWDEYTFSFNGIGNILFFQLNS